MTEQKTCRRPLCEFAPLPTLNERGELEESAFCSNSCAAFTSAAAALATWGPGPETDRHLRRLYHVGQILNLRTHPSEYDLPTDVYSATGAVDGG